MIGHLRTWLSSLKYGGCFEYHEHNFNWFVNIAGPTMAWLPENAIETCRHIRCVITCYHAIYTYVQDVAT